MLKLVAKAYSCTVSVTDAEVDIVQNDTIVHTFTKEEITFLEMGIPELFVEDVKEKLK